MDSTFSARLRPFGGIDANMLRLTAMLLMLLDHLWAASIFPENFWMTCVGRMAFPIFAFQITEGFFHTHSRKQYALRLLIFALLSEIPFDCFTSGVLFYPFDQNVLFTLLLGLAAISGLDHARRERTPKAILLGALAALGAWLLACITFVDYGGLGVLTVAAFYLLRGFRGAWLCQLGALIFLNMVLFQGQELPLTLLHHTFMLQQQGFAVLSLLPIWLYNGKKGVDNKILQYSAYAFYPVHMLILYGLHLLSI